MDAPLLEMRGIVKQFPGVRALDGIDLEVRAGEVHCLLGPERRRQVHADQGALRRAPAGRGRGPLQGPPVSLPNPFAAMKLGIAAIYQELDLVDGLSVADNVHLGRETSTAGFVHRGDQVESTRTLLTRLGHADIPPNHAVERDHH